MIHRIPLSFVCIVIAAICIVQVTAEEARAVETKQYSLIFNCDGHAVFKDAQGDMNQWIENLFGPLTDSQVDVLFWCDGAGGNTANYDSQVLELSGIQANKVNPHLQKMIDEGNDPPKVVIRESRKRNLDVFYSFRINDIHDSFIPEEMATFKKNNPAWMIGERDYDGVLSFRSSLNFAVPEVRDLKFRVIEELFQKYDFDGLEIDFMRSAPYFLPGEEPKNAHLLTRMLRRIRQHLIQRGRERGRPIPLAVRVNESLHSCYLDGFEVGQWLDNDLIDILSLGSGVIDIEVEEFNKLAAPKGVLVYPCLYGWPSRYSPVPEALAQGMALTYWQQGAGGIYLFNWFPHTKNNSENNGPYMTGLLKKLGDADVLRESKSPLMFVADRGRPSRAYAHNWLHSILPVELAAKSSVKFDIRSGVSFSTADQANIQLQLTVDKLQNGDQVMVEFNGRPLDGINTDSAGKLIATVDSSRLRLGANDVVVTATKLSSNSDEPRTLTAAELHVRRD